MNKGELGRYQSEHRVHTLVSLAMLCRSRFLRAADLVGKRSAAIDSLRAFGISDRIDLSPLIPAWQVLCDRYVKECYDPQADLFSADVSNQEATWTSFVYHNLFPHLVREDEFVRNVLRALGALPCKSKEHAVRSLSHYFAEMVLPSDGPPWAAEEEIEQSI